MNHRLDFLIFGAHKSASTSLYHYLAKHPHIFLPEIEENRFFTMEEFYRQGHSFLAPFYEGLRDERVIGGKNVHVMYFEESARWVRDYNPEMRLIAILRNPIERAYSAYWFARRNGWETCESFKEALELETLRARGTYEEQSELTYLAHGHYYSQLGRFFTLFGEDQIRVILTKDLADDPTGTVRDLWRWLRLEADTVSVDDDIRRMSSAMPRFPALQRALRSRDSWHKVAARAVLPQTLRIAIQQRVLEKIEKLNLRQSTYPPLDESLRCSLREYYSRRNQRLASLIDRDLSHWT